MTSEEMDLFRNIINDEESVLELEKVKNILESRIEEINKTKKYKGFIADEHFKMIKSILLQDFRDFYKKNQPKCDNFKYNILADSVRSFLKIDGMPKVFHIIELGSYELMKVKNFNSFNINTLEECLNKYGLSLNQEFTDTQLIELNSIINQIENGKTKKYC